MIKEYNSQRVTVSGSVKTSGVYAIKGNTSLMQVIAMAGDVDTSTDSGDVVVFRTIDGQRSAAKFDIDAIKAGKAARSSGGARRRRCRRFIGYQSRVAQRFNGVAAGVECRRVLGAVSVIS